MARLRAMVGKRKASSCLRHDWEQYAFRNYRCRTCGKTATREERFKSNKPRQPSPVQSVKDHFGFKSNPGSRASFGGQIVVRRPLSGATVQIERTPKPISIYGEPKGRYVATVFVGQNVEHVGAYASVRSATAAAVKSIKKQNPAPPRFLPAGQTARRPRAARGEKALDKQIESAYYRVASGVQVSIMDIPKIFRDAKAELTGGRTDIDNVLIEVVKRYQTGVGGGRMLNNPKRGKGLQMPGGRKCCQAPELVEAGQGVECLNCRHWEGYDSSARQNPHGKGGAYFILDPATNKVLWIVRGHPMHSFNNSVTLAAQAAAKLGRSVIHVVHPYVPKGWKKGVVVTPLFYSYGANLIDASGKITQRNPKGGAARCNPSACANPGHRHAKKNPMLQMVTLANPSGGKKKLRFPSYCQPCIFRTHPQMMTGYSLKDQKCDRCGRLSDLAMVDTTKTVKNPLTRKEVANLFSESRSMMELSKRKGISRAHKAYNMGISLGLTKAATRFGPKKSFKSRTQVAYVGSKLWDRVMRAHGRGKLTPNPLRPAGVPYCVMCGNWAKSKGPYKRAEGYCGWATSQPLCKLCREGVAGLQADGYDFRAKPAEHKLPKSGYRPNPGSGAIPFKQGQIITVEQALAWAKKAGNASLIKQCDEAIRLCKKANGPAIKVRFDLVQMGDPKKIETVMAGVQYGETDETVYKPTKGSKKGQHLYRHEWGEGSGRRKPVPLIAPVGGKALVMPLGNRQTAGDWLRG